MDITINMQCKPHLLVKNTCGYFISLDKTLPNHLDIILRLQTLKKKTDTITFNLAVLIHTGIQVKETEEVVSFPSSDKVVVWIKDHSAYWVFIL